MRLLTLASAVLLLALLYRRHRRGSLIPVLRWPFLVLDFLLALAQPGFGIALENLALRQQLGVFKQKRPRPFLKRADRLFWVGFAGLRHAALELVVVVKPETVVGWHRLGWRAIWRWKSKPRGRPPKDKEIRDLIRKIARDNPRYVKRTDMLSKEEDAHIRACPVPLSFT